MAEREMRSKEDFLKIIEEICESNGIAKSQLEQEAGISQGLISRWRKSDYIPNLYNVLNVLQFLDVKLILRTNEPEDNSGMEEENNHILDEDTLIISLIVKILKSEITSSDKEKLYQILQVFV